MDQQQSSVQQHHSVLFGSHLSGHTGRRGQWSNPYWILSQLPSELQQSDRRGIQLGRAGASHPPSTGGYSSTDSPLSDVPQSGGQRNSGHEGAGINQSGKATQQEPQHPTPPPETESSTTGKGRQQQIQKKAITTTTPPLPSSLSEQEDEQERRLSPSRRAEASAERRSRRRSHGTLLSQHHTQQQRSGRTPTSSTSDLDARVPSDTILGGILADLWILHLLHALLKFCLFLMSLLAALSLIVMILGYDSVMVRYVLAASLFCLGICSGMHRNMSYDLQVLTKLRETFTIPLPRGMAAAAAVLLPSLLSMPLVMAHEHKLQGPPPCWGKELSSLLSQMEHSRLIHEEDWGEVQRLEFKHLSCESHYPLLCGLKLLWPHHLICNASTGRCRTDVSWIYEMGVKCETGGAHSVEQEEDCYLPTLEELGSPHRLPSCTGYFDLTRTADATMTCILLITALLLAFTIAHCTLSTLEEMRQQTRAQRLDGLPAPARSSGPSWSCDNCVIEFCFQLATAITFCMRNFQQANRIRYSGETGKKD